MAFWNRVKKNEQTITEQFRQGLDQYLQEKYMPQPEAMAAPAMMGGAESARAKRGMPMSFFAPASAEAREAGSVPRSVESEETCSAPQSAELEETCATPLREDFGESDILSDREMRKEPRAGISEMESEKIYSAPQMSPRRSLEDIIENVGESFSEMMMRLLIDKDLKNSEVYHNANISRKVFSKIMTNPDYHPKKNTVLSLAIGMKLNLDETKDLLRAAGYALSPGSKFDLIVQYCIENREYNIVKINIVLDDYRQPCLGET